MTKTAGPLTSPGATFIYKADKGAPLAWNDALTISNVQNIRAEWHQDRVDFLQALHDWNTQPNFQSDNSFLLVYAHMGPTVISPTGAKDFLYDPANLVPYEDLELNLPNRVHTLWLVGCKSQYARAKFHPVHGPVRGMLMATNESKAWRPLVRLFADEVNMNPIRAFDQMIEHVRKELPKELRNHVNYFEPIPRWRKAFP